MRAIVPSAKSKKYLPWICKPENNFPKKKLLGCPLSMVKIGQLSTKLGLLSWWFPSLYARDHIPLRAPVLPSVTNDHNLWSLHMGYLWRSPQHTQQIDLMTRHQMETFSASLLLLDGNSLVTDGFTPQRPVTRSFDVFFDLSLNKWLSKQSRFETPSRSL